MCVLVSLASSEDVFEFSNLALSTCNPRVYYTCVFKCWICFFILFQSREHKLVCQCVSLASGFVIDSLQQLFWCVETKADKVKEWWPVGSGHNDPAKSPSSSHILFYCGTDFCFPRSALPLLVSISPVFILVASYQLSDLFYLSSHFLALHCLWYLYNFFVFHFRTSETLQRIYFPSGIVATDHKSTVSSW